MILLLDFRVTDCGLNVLPVADEMLLERGNGSSHEMGFCSSGERVRKKINSLLINKHFRFQ